MSVKIPIGFDDASTFRNETAGCEDRFNFLPIGRKLNSALEIANQSDDSERQVFRREGNGHLIPDIELSEQTDYQIGKYGRMHLAKSSKTWNGQYGRAAEYHALENVLQYTADQMKTEMQYYVSGVNCDAAPDAAREQFEITKRNWKKEGGIVCFHGYQSFAQNEVTPEVAHAIGIELAKRLWGDRFEVLVTTHLNTKAVHNHFCLNSVSFVDGLRYYDQKATYRKMREVSDALCRQWGLSVIEPKGRGGILERSRMRKTASSRSEGRSRWILTKPSRTITLGNPFAKSWASLAT